MPLILPSRIDGISPEGLRTLRQIVDAINSLEALKTTAAPVIPDIAPLSTDLQTLRDDLAALQQQVNTLTPRAEEAEEPEIPGQPSLPPTPTPTHPNPGGPALGIIGAGSAYPTVALPNELATVQAYAEANPAQLANSCLDSGGSWDFMDGVVAALKAADSRFGYNGKRGDINDPSEDAVSYYHGVLPATDGSPDVYVIDIIGGHCGPNPTAAFSNVTTSAARGAYLANR